MVVWCPAGPSVYHQCAGGGPVETAAGEQVSCGLGLGGGPGCIDPSMGGLFCETLWAFQRLKLVVAS